MSLPTSFSRRRLIKTLFFSSVAMKVNLSHSLMAQEASASSLDLLAIGDFGTNNQLAVAKAMTKYAHAMGKPSEGLLLLGDNFYGPMPGGVKSERWQSGFSIPYPASTFPGPCWAVLGNHDYHDTPGNEKVQLGYAASLGRQTRWTMPGKYYRVDVPAVNPQVTFLMIDTNWESINKPIHRGGEKVFWMSAEEQAAQQQWLEAELASKRAPFTVVVGHHPIFSDAKHGDTPELVESLAPLLEKHGVHVYLCGHDHDLQHLELEGHRTSFVVSGGGGAKLYTHGKIRKGSVVNEVFGFSHLSFRDHRLHLRHIAEDGSIAHAFSKGVNHDWKKEV